LIRSGVALVVALFVVAGCGSSTDAGDQAGTTAPAATVEPGVPTGPPADDDAGACAVTGVDSTTGLAYPATDGTGHPALLVDVHRPVLAGDCRAVPAMVWVHGGGWRTGSRTRNLEDKVDLVVRRLGWALVGVDYRLSPDPGGPPDRPADQEGVRFPTHTEDVAAAVGWVQREAGRFGVDPRRIGLMGHSAGAQIVSLVATDERYLEGAGVERRDVRCVVALDTNGFDVAAMAERSEVYRNAFGQDPTVWREASAITQIEDGEPFPELLMVVQDRSRRVAGNRAFADALTAAGGEATVVVAPGLDHAGINRAVGAAGDEVVTPAVAGVMERCAR
jgi:arylformamidase